MTMLSSQTYPHGTQHPLMLPGASGSQYGGSSMGVDVAGPSGSLSFPSDMSGVHFPSSHHSMYSNYHFNTGPPEYATGLSQMHGLGSALTTDTQGSVNYTHSPSPSDSSLDEDGSAYSSSSPPPSTNPLPTTAETEEYLRRTLEIPRHVPVDLNALSEPDKKQPPITNMIKLAIWGSKHKKLTLRQIYDEIEKRFPSLKESKDKPWQRSIRHNLSLKAIFVRVERPVSHPGKGFYWAIDIRQGEGNKRDRKRKDHSGSGKGSRSHEDEDDFSEDLEDDEPSPQRVIQGRSGERRGTRQPLRLPQEGQILPGPYTQPSGSLLQRQPGLSQGASLLNPSHPLPPSNTGPNMRWDQRSQYPNMPASSSSSPSHRHGMLPTMTNMGMQMQMDRGGPPPGFPNYTLPPNIEHNPFGRNATEPVLGRQNFPITGYPQGSISMPQMGQSSSMPQTVQPSMMMMGMPAHGHHSSGSSSRRPSPEDDDPSNVRRLRRHRAQ